MLAGDLNIGSLDPSKEISDHLSDPLDVFDLNNILKITNNWVVRLNFL